MGKAGTRSCSSGAFGDILLVTGPVSRPNAWPPLMTAGPRFEMSSRSSDARCSLRCGSQFMALSLIIDAMKPAKGKEELDVPREPPSRLPRQELLGLVGIISDLGLGDGVLRLLLSRELGDGGAEFCCVVTVRREERRAARGDERIKEAARHRRPRAPARAAVVRGTVLVQDELFRRSMV